MKKILEQQNSSRKKFFKHQLTSLLNEENWKPKVYTYKEDSTIEKLNYYLNHPIFLSKIGL
jgi:hypothetical protein